jgi:sugar phosphate isomerase/epimerase
VKLSICSYSFHRTLLAGKQDIFKYIDDCERLGATHLEPWIAHFGTARGFKYEEDPENKWSVLRSMMEQALPADPVYLEKIVRATHEAGLIMNGIAVDGAHIYDHDETVRQFNRQRAYEWLDVAEMIGASQMRIDSGGDTEMPDDVFKIIVKGYEDLVERGKAKGVQILIENHWGASQNPQNVVRILDAVKGLGLLFDTHNWPTGYQERGWQLCAKYASATHIKTFEFDEHGNDPNVDLPRAIKLLRDTGFEGVWGIESVPRYISEYEGAKRTIDLIDRVLG